MCSQDVRLKHNKVFFCCPSRLVVVHIEKSKTVCSNLGYNAATVVKAKLFLL